MACQPASGYFMLRGYKIVFLAQTYWHILSSSFYKGVDFLHTVIWYQVFLSEINNLHTVKWIQVIMIIILSKQL